MDRQELRLVFERGDVTLFDWVPTRVKIHAIADEADTRAICEIFPGARLDVAMSYGGKDRACEGRHKPLDVYQTFDLSWGEGTVKSHRYCELLRGSHDRPACLDRATIPTVGESARTTAEIPWPSPVPPTGWRRLDGCRLAGKGVEQ